MGLLIRPIVLVLLLIFPCRALACPESIGSPLQLMKSALDYYPTVSASRVIEGADCAMEHFEASRVRENEFRQEKSTINYRYGRFLKEAADLQHRAAKRVRQTGGGNGGDYFANEIRMRTALLGWCLKDANACDAFQQLGALGNAFESARLAPEMHDWMVSNSPESLAVRAVLDIWLRAVYSCPAWDFRPPIERGLFVSKETCSPSCVEVARRASAVLEEHGTRISSLRGQINALTQSVDACPHGGG